VADRQAEATSFKADATPLLFRVSPTRIAPDHLTVVLSVMIRRRNPIPAKQTITAWTATSGNTPGRPALYTVRTGMARRRTTADRDHARFIVNFAGGYAGYSAEPACETDH
jgi:hypothetical protein